MKRFLKGILIAFVTFIVFMAAFAFAVWEKPALLLNERNARIALGYLPNGWKVGWGSLECVFQAEGAWGKRIRLSLRDLRVTLPGISSVVPEVSVDASVSVAGFRPRLTVMRLLRLNVSELKIKPAAPDAPVPAGANPLPDLRPPSFAALLPADFDLDQIAEVSLRLEHFTIDSPEPLVANAHLEKTPSAAGTAEFSLDAKVDRGRNLAIHAHGNGEIHVKRREFAWKGAVDGILNGWKVALPFQATWTDRIALRGRASAKRGRDLFASPVSIDWAPSSLSLGLTHLEFEQLWPQKKISLDECRFESTLDHRHGFPKQSQLHCDLSLTALRQGALLPPLRAKLSAELGLSATSGEAIDVDFKLHELGTNAYLNSKIEAAAKGRFLTRKGEPEGEPHLELAVNLHVPELQTWKKSLDQTPLAIPAPFRTLSGPANLDVTLERATKEAITAKVMLATNFTGGRQAFVTNHVAHVTLANPWAGKKALSVNARVELTDVALEAPPLKLESPPQFLPDRRFEPTRKQVKATVPQSSIPLHWTAELITANPVRIRSNLLEAELPLKLDLQFSDETDLAGTLSVQEMPLQVFKKKAEVKHINVAFHDGSKQGEVDGLAIYQNPEITIQILLLGSTDKPRVEFISNPPLNRSQIVSVLLFNKSVSELTDEEAASAGSFSEATADGALGLFSLLFLSSTPIESISYDPVSQTYAARVRLGDKTTLSVGSNFERERQVALRRRLSGRWAIRTELHDQEGKPDVVLTLLEWFKRF